MCASEDFVTIWLGACVCVYVSSELALNKQHDIFQHEHACKHLDELDEKEKTSCCGSIGRQKKKNRV